MGTGKLFIVATPIGNLDDLSFRAIETLKSVDFILCEDTRVTQKLLHHFEIKTPTVSYHHHSDEKKIREIMKMLSDGKMLALVSDAGTPGISDPGNLLIERLLMYTPALQVVPIPGASAVVSALSICGFQAEKFLFLGFPPHKNKRQKFFQTVAASEYTVVFYESSHRITKALQSLKEFLSPERKICVCRELTKSFESVYRGTIGEVSEMNIPEKGEFVLVINGQ